METIKVKVVKSRKGHTCDMCGRAIQKGDAYEVQTNKSDGVIYNWKNCLVCIPTVERMHQNGYYPDGVNAEQYAEYVAENREVLRDGRE